MLIAGGGGACRKQSGCITCMAPEIQSRSNAEQRAREMPGIMS
jgi:hypothetical protein